MQIKSINATLLIKHYFLLSIKLFCSIYPSAHVPGTVQIPISGNNTGSLPDLTNVNFSSPIRVPLDQDPEQGGSSPYSSVSLIRLLICSILLQSI